MRKLGFNTDEFYKYINDFNSTFTETPILLRSQIICSASLNTSKFDDKSQTNYKDRRVPFTKRKPETRKNEYFCPFTTSKFFVPGETPAPVPASEPEKVEPQVTQAPRLLSRQHSSSSAKPLQRVGSKGQSTFTSRISSFAEESKKKEQIKSSHIEEKKFKPCVSDSDKDSDEEEDESLESITPVRKSHEMISNSSFSSFKKQDTPKQYPVSQPTISKPFSKSLHNDDLEEEDSEIDSLTFITPMGTKKFNKEETISVRHRIDSPEPEPDLDPEPIPMQKPQIKQEIKARPSAIAAGKITISRGGKGLPGKGMGSKGMGGKGMGKRSQGKSLCPVKRETEATPTPKLSAPSQPPSSPPSQAAESESDSPEPISRPETPPEQKIVAKPKWKYVYDRKPEQSSESASSDSEDFEEPPRTRTRGQRRERAPRGRNAEKRGGGGGRRKQKDITEKDEDRFLKNFAAISDELKDSQQITLANEVKEIIEKQQPELTFDGDDEEPNLDYNKLSKEVKIQLIEMLKKFYKKHLRKDYPEFDESSDE